MSVIPHSIRGFGKYEWFRGLGILNIRRWTCGYSWNNHHGHQTLMPRASDLGRSDHWWKVLCWAVQMKGVAESQGCGQCSSRLDTAKKQIVPDFILSECIQELRWVVCKQACISCNPRGLAPQVRTPVRLPSGEGPVPGSYQAPSYWIPSRQRGASTCSGDS